jgi:hypothetical protein
VAAAVVLVLLGWGIGVISRKPAEKPVEQSAAPVQPASTDVAAPAAESATSSEPAVASPSTPLPVPEEKAASSGDQQNVDQQNPVQQNAVQQNADQQRAPQAEVQPPVVNHDADTATAKAEQRSRLRKAPKAQLSSPQLSSTQLRSSSATPATVTPVSARAPSLSGNWHGEYTNYDKNQTTPVKLQIISEIDRADQLTGTLMFGAEGNNSSSCTLTGVYNAQTKFMLLSVSNCQGSAPTNLQGKFGFSSVTLTDSQAFGMGSAHNGLLNISR